MKFLPLQWLSKAFITGNERLIDIGTFIKVNRMYEMQSKLKCSGKEGVGAMGGLKLIFSYQSMMRNERVSNYYVNQRNFSITSTFPLTRRRESWGFRDCSVVRSSY